MHTNDYPAITGDTVTERHARICRESGHAIWIRDGIPAPFCPRCGDVAGRDTWEAASTPIVTRDRYGTRAYVWPTGESVSNDGYGRMSWSLYVGNEWTACYDSRGEALADYGLAL